MGGQIDKSEAKLPKFEHQTSPKNKKKKKRTHFYPISRNNENKFLNFPQNKKKIRDGTTKST